MSSQSDPSGGSSDDQQPPSRSSDDIQAPSWSSDDGQPHDPDATLVRGPLPPDPTEPAATGKQAGVIAC